MASERPGQDPARSGTRYGRLRRRLHAWWEGVELPPEPRFAPMLGSRPGEPLLLDMKAPPDVERDWPESAEDRAKTWPSRRMEAAELIWGRDCILPGGADYTLEIARPLGLTPALTLLDLAAGLGGGTRALAKSFGTWVTGLERDTDLAREASSRSAAAGLSGKAPVQAFDIDDFELRKRSFDCLLARELFYSVADKQRLFSALQRGLKDRGQLLFTDYVLGVAPRADAYERWTAGERLPCYPSALDELMALMQGLGLDCRIAVDESERYRGEIMAAWARIAEQLQRAQIPRHLLGRVVEEAERWTRFVQVLDRGELRLYRFHAFFRES